MHNCGVCVVVVSSCLISIFVLFFLFFLVMDAVTSAQHHVNTSGIPVPVRMRQLRNKSPDLPMQRSSTGANESADGGPKRRIFHRRTYSHDANAALPTGHKTKSKPLIWKCS